MNTEAKYKNDFDQRKPQSEAKSWRKIFARLRQQFRQILYEKGVMSNPAVEVQWITDQLRKLLEIENSPHRFLDIEWK